MRFRITGENPRSAQRTRKQIIEESKTLQRNREQEVSEAIEIWNRKSDEEEERAAASKRNQR